MFYLTNSPRSTRTTSKPTSRRITLIATQLTRSTTMKTTMMMKILTMMMMSKLNNPRESLSSVSSDEQGLPSFMKYANKLRSTDKT